MKLASRFKSLIPKRETLVASRGLRWLSPWLGHPALWRWSRRSVALGVALGVFFGLLIPLAQIPVASAAAIVLRANLPIAAASTLVTNPVTFGPVYLAAYRLGHWLTGSEAPAGTPDVEAILASDNASPAPPLPSAATGIVADSADNLLLPVKAELVPAAHEAAADALSERQTGVWQRVASVGKPLMVGLATLATMSALAIYVLVSVLWRWRVLYRRRTRTREPGA